MSTGAAIQGSGPANPERVAHSVCVAHSPQAVAVIKSCLTKHSFFVNNAFYFRLFCITTTMLNGCYMCYILDFLDRDMRPGS